jgi:hypothetical protein
MMILKTSRSNLSSNDQLSLDLPFAATKSLTARVGPTPTFTRGSGATYIGSDGLIHGVDTSTTSNTIGTGSRTFTLAATAGQDQFWRAGDAVEASNGSNSMVGTVTSYNAATQSLVCNMISTGGSGTFTSWRIGYRGPRFDHTSAGVCRGLLIEEGRTNAAFQSGVIVNNIGWVVSSSATGATSVASGTGPDSNTSYLISESATTAPHGLYNTGTNTVTLGASVTSGVAYTASAFVKKVTGSIDWIQIILGTGGFGSQYANFNLTTGQFGNVSGLTTRVEEHANGWYRISVTRNATVTTSTTATFGINFINNTNGTTSGPSYAGSTSNQFLLTMCQFETGSFPTSYIPTTTGSVVRSADVCSITGANFTSFYNQSEGTIIGGGSLNNPNTTASPELFKVNDGTNNNRIQIGMTNVIGEAVRPIIVTSGSLVYNNANGTSAVGIERKIGTAYKTNDARSAFNGSLGALDTTVPLPVGVNQAFLFVGCTGTISFLRYYKKRLPDSKLQALTA